MPMLDWKHEPMCDSLNAFRARINLYFEDQEITALPKQAIKLKIAIGDEGMRRLLSSGLSEADKKKPDKIFELLENQLDASVKINFRVHRLEFAQIRQKSDETINDFVSRLREKASKCEFGDDELNQRLIEMVILSTPYDDLRKELLGKAKEYTIARAIERGREFEAIAASQQSIKHLYNKESNVDAIRKQFSKPCGNCDLRHEYRQCPAFNDECRNCKRKGHWAKCCRSKIEKHKGKSDKTTRKYHKRKTQVRGHDLTIQNDDHRDDSCPSDEYEQTFHAITNLSSQAEAYTKLNVMHNGKILNGRLHIKIDTGAAGNILPLRTYSQMFKCPLEKFVQPEHKVKLTSYSDTRIPCLGSISLNIKKKSQNRYHPTKFYVVDVAGPAILGLPSCKALRIVDIHIDNINSMLQKIKNIEDLKNLYPDSFDKIGNFKVEEKLQLKPNAEPFVDPPRRCPIHLKNQIKQKLDQMVEDDIIMPISKPTQWCSSLTYPTKQDGSLRICLDPRKLNQNLVKRPHKIPSVEEITPHFAKAKYFSKLDAKAGYWSVKLHKSSRELTTFRTPHGRYCFKRLPFGLNISQDAYQERMDTILDKCEGVTGISDDVVVFGETEEEHDKNLINLMNVARNEGLVFNSAKCKIKAKEITFFGRKYTDKGVFPDPNKIKDIINMATPQTKDELQTFLGMITFLSNHIPNSSQETAILRDLLKTNVPFDWSEDHQECFKNLKQLVAKSIGLKYFDHRQETELEVDASIKGLGVSLTQGGHPIAFASKALTPAQSNYSNLERECLAVVFGIERFHHYLFGKDFKVITDCKPLQMILQKPIHCAPPRLQRILVKIVGYNFSIHHKAGKDNIIPDALSRLPNFANNDDIELDIMVDDIRYDVMNFSKNKQEQLKVETERDPVLHKLAQIVNEGWPDTLGQLPPELRLFWTYRDEIGLSGGILFKGNQVLIPENLRQDILGQLHEGHQGIEKTRKLARKYVYWTNFNKDIEKLCRECSYCQKYQAQQPKEEIIFHERPQQKWKKLGTDLFTTNGRDYLIISDYFSRYPYIKQICSLTASRVIKETKECFSLFGIPSEIISDNGPCYSSEYDEMCDNLGINHTRISPRHPQGNGFIERQIGYIKPIIKKCIESGGDINIALLNVRATPIDSKLPSPAELMFGNKVSTVLPNVSHEVPNDSFKERMEELTENQRHYANRHSKYLRPLLNGERVRVLDHNKKVWFPGQIIQTNRNRSYHVQTEGGGTIIRNRIQLRPIPDPPPLTSPNPSKSIAPLPRAHVQTSMEGQSKQTSTTNSETTARRSDRQRRPPSRLINEI